MTNIDGIGDPARGMKFNDIGPMQYGDVSAQLTHGMDLDFISIEMDSEVLDVDEARALYEWLGKVLS
jgi:hypothetical protein